MTLYYAQNINGLVDFGAIEKDGKSGFYYHVGIFKFKLPLLEVALMILLLFFKCQWLRISWKRNKEDNDSELIL